MTVKLSKFGRVAIATTAMVAVPMMAGAETLRLLTWGGYAPEEVIAKFEEETGHTV